MWYYLINDLLAALKWLPLGVLFAFFAGFVIRFFKRNGRLKKISVVDGVFIALFVAYMAVIVCITFLSRESGSRIGFDMRIFSTWGINKRNNAYVIENVLLFIPLGVLAPRVFGTLNHVFYCTLAGFLFSTSIEVLQYLTKRGFFQIDDIITNTLGMFIGCVLYKVFMAVVRQAAGAGRRKPEGHRTVTGRDRRA